MDEETPSDEYQTPRWVKVFAVGAALLAALLLVGFAAGSLGGLGDHGPNRHFGDDERGTGTPTTSPAGTTTGTTSSSPAGDPTR